MIGQPDWFNKRKYGGWGLSPKTWKGWAYIGMMILIPWFYQSYIAWDKSSATIGVGVLVGIMLLDVVHIMILMDKGDERDQKIEALAERNAAWAMVVVLALGVGYQAVQSAILKTSQVDPFLIVTLLVGSLVKMLSNLKLAKKSL